MKNHTVTPSLEALFRSAPNQFVVLDPDFRIVAANDAFLLPRMFQRQDILGKHLFDIMPERFPDSSGEGETSLKASLERVLATGRPDRMAVHRDQDSSSRRLGRRDRGDVLEPDQLPGS
jgi:PAS domain-containing protein